MPQQYQHQLGTLRRTQSQSFFLTRGVIAHNGPSPSPKLRIPIPNSTSQGHSQSGIRPTHFVAGVLLWPLWSGDRCGLALDLPLPPPRTGSEVLLKILCALRTSLIQASTLGLLPTHSTVGTASCWHHLQYLRFPPPPSPLPLGSFRPPCYQHLLEYPAGTWDINKASLPHTNTNNYYHDNTS